MGDVIVVLFRSVFTAAALGLFQSTTSSTPYYIASTESYEPGGLFCCMLTQEYAVNNSWMLINIINIYKQV